MTWNLTNIIVCLVVAALVIAVIVNLIKNKKNGKTSCSSSQGCNMMGGCRSKTDK